MINAAKTKARKIITCWENLNEEDQELLGREMGLTGVKDVCFPWGAAYRFDMENGNGSASLYS